MLFLYPQNFRIMNRYKQRVSDTILSRKLAASGAVLIEGPKWCGKTTTAKRVAVSLLDLGNSKVFEQSVQMMQIEPSALLSGKAPQLIDEWQLLPTLWDTIRNEVDNRGEEGQFILTGSSVPPDLTQLHHSGTGRYARLKMRPMSLWESGESSGKVRLGKLFAGESFKPFSSDNTLENISKLTCRGGWPRATFLKGQAALDQAYDYYDAVTGVDIMRVDGTRRSTERARCIMRSYARNQGHQIPFTTICSDVKVHDTQSINDDTVADYINALRKLFVVEDMPAWNPNLRSKTAIRTAENRYFVDPSIAVAALGVGPGDLMRDLKTFGMFFETLAVRDLRVYADALDGEVYHYRDSNGLECDAVVHLRNGQYGLIEIKLGGLNSIDEGADHLNALATLIDTQKMCAPAFRLVLTAVTPYAYQRKDGVFVVPITCLMP